MVVGFLEVPSGLAGPLFLFALLGNLSDEHAADVVLLVSLVGLIEHVGRVLHQVRLFECLGCLDGGHGERVADLDVLAAAEGLEAGERLADVFLQCDAWRRMVSAALRRFTLLSMSLLIAYSPLLVRSWGRLAGCRFGRGLGQAGALVGRARPAGP